MWFSRILSLHDFAILSLIVMIAGGIGATSAPLMTTFLPNFCKRYALNISMEEKYKDFDRIVSIYIAVATITASPMILRSFDVLYGWTNDITIAISGEVTLTVYAIGFLIQAVGGLVYFLQYARGNMSQHLKGSIFFAVTYTIILIFLGARFGILGAALAWVIVNIIYICTWVFYSAGQFGEKFLKLIVLWAPIKAAIIPLFCCYILLFILPISMGRYFSIFNIAFVLISCFLLQLLTNRHFRIFFLNLLYRFPVIGPHK
jgi:O-antigen/teichoic acid export membrane protein